MVVLLWAATAEQGVQGRLNTAVESKRKRRSMCENKRLGSLERSVRGVESTLAVIGTGGPYCIWGVESTLAVIGTGGPVK
eukprot:8977588-Pyramimonas_sp.AAC.2